MIINLNENCTLIYGDCYEYANTFQADAIITDPPYNFDASGGGLFRNKRHNMDKIMAAGIDKGFDLSILSAFGVKSCVTFCHENQLTDIRIFLEKTYTKGIAQCFWKKLNPMPVANKNYQPELELYIHAWSQGYEPQGTVNELKRCWIGNSPRAGAVHPTQKPYELMFKIVGNVKGETIIDPFMGSGTTGIAALSQGRKFIGIEHNKEFFDLALERVERHLNQGVLNFEQPKKYEQTVINFGEAA